MPTPTRYLIQSAGGGYTSAMLSSYDSRNFQTLDEAVAYTAGRDEVPVMGISPEEGLRLIGADQASMITGVVWAKDSGPMLLLFGGRE